MRHEPLDARRSRDERERTLFDASVLLVVTLRGDRARGGEIGARVDARSSLVGGLAAHEAYNPLNGFRHPHPLDRLRLAHVRDERNAARRVLLEGVENALPAEGHTGAVPGGEDVLRVAKLDLGEEGGRGEGTLFDERESHEVHDGIARHLLVAVGGRPERIEVLEPAGQLEDNTAGFGGEEQGKLH